MNSLKTYQDLLDENYQQLLRFFTFPEISTTTYCLVIFAICIPPIIALIIYEKEQARLLAQQPKGCRKMGMKIETNLANEFDPKFSEGRPPSVEETSAEWWRIKSLWIYPIKSCRGVELNRGTIWAKGMHYDRQFTFAQLRSPFPVDARTPEKEKADHKWEIITQKQYPRLSEVRTQMWIPDQSVDSYSPHCEDVESEGVIIISFPWQKPGWRGTLAKWGAAVKGTVPEMQFRVPFNPTPTQVQKAGYTSEKLTIWNHTITALNMETELPEQLRFFLGISNKLGLFRSDMSTTSVAPREIAQKREETIKQPIVGFQDAYPVHLVNLATIRDIESRMLKTSTTPRLSAAKFRANLIITGPEAYHERTWRKVKIGFYEYDISDRQSRALTNESPKEDSPKQHEDSWNRIIHSYRTEEEGPGLSIDSFGVQMTPLSAETALRVGDEITLLEIDASYPVDH